MRGDVGYSLSGNCPAAAREPAHAEVLVSADDVSKGKPHPEPYLMGAKLLGVNPTECLVIEDAPAGIRAAHAGGMKAIGITSTYPAPELQEADAVGAKLGADKS